MVSNNEPTSRMYEIIRKKDRIENVTRRLSQDLSVFGNISLDIPRLFPPELGLLRVVSWFYVLFFETGKINISFVMSRFISYNLDPDNKQNDQLMLTNNLRTYFQHNLDPSKDHDKQIQSYCENWFKESCGTFLPESESHWLSCLNNYISRMDKFLLAIEDCLRKIEQDESLEEILDNWKLRRSRYHPPHEFDELIGIITADIGRPHIDAIKLRKQYYETWTRELQSLTGEYEFETEARKLIEYTILSQKFTVLPINGSDIMAFFNIPPGRKVGELWQIAKEIYENDPCDRDDLLIKLKQIASTII